MPLPLAELRALLEAEKRIGQTPSWDVASDPRWTSFTVPLIVGDVVPEGLQLRGSALKGCWDRNVAFQLEVAPTGRKPKLPLPGGFRVSGLDSPANQPDSGIPPLGPREVKSARLERRQ